MVDLCNHFRIRDTNTYGRDPEECIKSIEKRYNADIKTLPQWKEIAKRLHVKTTDLNKRIQECKARKASIAHRLFIESARLTPFELNDIFARTRNKWKRIELASETKNKQKNVIKPEPLIVLKTYESKLNVDEEVETMHPNTEMYTPTPKLKEMEEWSHLNTHLKFPSIESKDVSQLPPYICRNKNLKFPSIKSEDVSQLSYHSDTDSFQPSSIHDEWMLLKRTATVASPPIVRITHDVICEQTLNIPVTNMSSHIKFIRYQDVVCHEHFKWAKIVPSAPQRLYPGLPVVLKFVFKLKEYKLTFATELRFKVGYGLYSGAPVEALRISLVTDFIRARNIFVPPVVKIPPLYAWHFMADNEYPKTVVNIVIDDDYDYHLHIRKRKGDLIQTQVHVTETNVAELDDTSSKITDDENEEDVYDLLKPIAKEIVERSLDVFILEKSYVSLIKTDKKKKRKVKVEVYFTKIANSGSHSMYYDFLFIEPRSGDVIITKACRIFADIIPHPLKIDPPHILVMADAPLYHGYGEGSFTITNTNKIHLAYVKISVTKQIMKLFKIIPMKATIPTSSKVAFEVKYCTVDRLRQEKDYVHCVIKIYVSGYETIYKNVPPFSYELVGPCVIYYNHLIHNPAMLVDRTELG